jgi:hypothetical protein
MELPPMRDSSGKESPRAPWNPCDVKYGEAGWPSLEPIGTIRQPQAVCDSERHDVVVSAQCVTAGAAAMISWFRRAARSSITWLFSSMILMPFMRSSGRDGVKVIEAPHAFGDTRAFMIEDPDGLAIELVAAPSPKRP